jgi:hypothetical protein
VIAYVFENKFCSRVDIDTNEKRPGAIVADI